MNVARSERKKDKAQWDSERTKQEVSIQALENSLKEQERRRDKLRSDLEERDKKRGKMDTKWAKVASLEDELRRLKEEITGVKEGAAVFAAAMTGGSPIGSPAATPAMIDQASGSTLRATAPAFFAPQTSTSASQPSVDDSMLPSGALTPRSRLIREHALATATQSARLRSTATSATDESQVHPYRAYPHLGSLPASSAASNAAAMSGRTLDPHKPEFVPTWLQPALSAPQETSAGTEAENAGDFAQGYHSEDRAYSQALYRAHDLSQPNPYLSAPGQPFNLAHMQGFPDFAAFEAYRNSDTMADTSVLPSQLVHGSTEDDNPEDAETDAETVDGDDLDFDPTLKLPPSFARSRQLPSSSTSPGALQKPRPRSIVLSNPSVPDGSTVSPSTPRHWPTSDSVPGLSFEHGLGNGSAPTSPTSEVNVVRLPMPPPGLIQNQRSSPRFHSSSPTAHSGLSKQAGSVSPSLSMPGSPLSARHKASTAATANPYLVSVSSGQGSPVAAGPRFVFPHRRVDQGIGEGLVAVGRESPGERGTIGRTASE
ncbi:unnamed protein product [Tilletia laevis]|nr:unnamed protein product [Tilletia caries]CAD6896373.1 unnamed protein product [Tilletia caries]CAD6904783.1 unnamed protein product [Tilletia caries]CAD6909071.1 unnamed protein product [Tilletia laevis]CAD7061797.1 unnamed protein product [Tilletia caries]